MSKTIKVNFKDNKTDKPKKKLESFEEYIGNIQTIGELKNLLKRYPDDMPIVNPYFYKDGHAEVGLSALNISVCANVDGGVVYTQKVIKSKSGKYKCGLAILDDDERLPDCNPLGEVVVDTKEVKPLRYADAIDKDLQAEEPEIIEDTEKHECHCEHCHCHENDNDDRKNMSKEEKEFVENIDKALTEAFNYNNVFDNDNKFDFDELKLVPNVIALNEAVNLLAYQFEALKCFIDEKLKK